MPYSTITLYKQNTDKEKFAIIYYRHAGTPLRHRTGVTVNLKNWDKKTNLVKQSDSNHQTKNNSIKQIHLLIEQIIEEFVTDNGFKPNSQYVKEQILSGRKLKKDIINANIIDCYNDFFEEKKIELSSPEYSIESLKDYTSCKNALIDYSAVVGTIQPSKLNDRIWLSQFNTFLSKVRPNISGYEFITRKQNDYTRIKRFSVLKTFGSWLVKNKYIVSNDVLQDYKIKKLTKNFYALSLSEIKKIQEKTFKNVSQQKAIDMFILACHTGLRFSDVIRLKKTRVSEYDNVSLLKMNNQKTKEEIEVPLSKKALEILKKYNFNLKLMTDQKANFYLHEALATVDDFKPEIEYGVEGDAKPKFDLITFHTGRRTFITNLVNNNINLNAIMKMTGHKKISTLQKYIDTDYKLILEHIKIFNDL